jgi:2-polyprenyl-6-hydroxyphenyl methylase/3-demethylubiquinone-9 3-methyltransferase
METIGKLVRDGGYVFISTINKNLLSYLTVILGAEYIGRIVPVGTHNWEKFLKPNDLRKIGERGGLVWMDEQGFCYNPLFNEMKKSKNLDVNYIMVFKKPNLKNDV